MGYDIGYDPNEYIFKGVLKEPPEGQTIKLGNYSVTSTKQTRLEDNHRRTRKKYASKYS